MVRASAAEKIDQRVIRSPGELKVYQEEILAEQDPDRPLVIVCHGTGCLANGSPKVSEALREAIADHKIKAKVMPGIKTTGCHGFCSRGPLVIVRPAGLFYQRVAANDAEEIVQTSLIEGKPVRRLLYQQSQTEEHISLETEIPFYKNQERIVLRNIGKVDPIDIRDTIARGGYQALAKALKIMTPDEVIKSVEQSGLRGRGGAGFPTGRKWRSAMTAFKKRGGPVYVVCNGDEGDPGAFMDRTIMEGDPHAVLEGMIIGAFALGCRQGYIYVRAEYPVAIKHLTIAMDQARSLGLLGENILGTDFSFDIQINRGAGAFVCGESTALFASLEGKAGEPRPKYVRSVEEGLWGKPTVLNNVETWANVPLIIEKGADWYAAIGVPHSTGTKVFSLVGKVNNIGLVEVPMGIPLWKIIEDIGGGVPGGMPFKAVQTGGPSGGCIPYSLKDVAVDYDSLTKVGSMMGSGGMIVMDHRDCVVDIARYFLRFLEEESCGKCMPCRLGLTRMREMLDAFSRGQGTEQDLEDLNSLAQAIKDGSLCALGGSAPNPVLTTVRYFRDEYLAHILEKRCPAGVCKRLSPAPCQFACPAGIDVPSYVALIGEGRYAEALDLIREDNPLPSVCGYVCPAPCEIQCRRGEGDQPISIKSLKRFVSDFVREQGEGGPQANISRPQKVAIIGSGPAGLSAAYYLAREGYPVTVFEALPVLGGMLRVGIPDYRLPQEVLDFDIQAIGRLGVQFKTRTAVGNGLNLDALKAEGYQAFLLAAGAHQEVRLGISGEERPGVFSGVEFLRQVALGEKVHPGRNVAVVGGGNVAMDAARTALRLGSRVTVLYRRTEAEMPAYPEEIAQAREEGVDIRYLTQPVEILGDDQGVTGVICLTMELGEPDASGRRRPVPRPGSETILPLDGLIKAIGQAPEPLPLSLEGKTLQFSTRGLVEVHPIHLSTNLPGVFAGGDNVTGPATVVEAVAAGKRAARSIHRYLQGEPYEDQVKIPTPRRRIDPLMGSEEEGQSLVRPKMPEEEVPQRIQNFRLVELGLSAEDCRNEAKRCLRCDLGD
jgi:NADH-quinone oxidoreductase subunit F